MSDQPRYPHADGLRVAEELVRILEPESLRIIIAGSLRRMKPTVGDVEILYVPKFITGPDPDDLFGIKTFNTVDEIIFRLEHDGILHRRKNVNGSEMFGDKNKLMVHTNTGIPVDLFSTTLDCWHNYLVCRTGPADSNALIAVKANRIGHRWNPYGRGFTEIGTGEIIPMDSEESVFSFVGIPYQSPEARQ